MPGNRSRPDAAGFVLAFREELGLSETQLPVYLEEIGSTLAGHCYKQLHSTASAAELAAGTGDAIADFQTIEAAMTEGHPCFVANNGRLGFGAEDYRAYAPEAGTASNSCGWPAHGTRAPSPPAGIDDAACCARNSARTALDGRFAAACAALGLDPADSVFIPVHPWQWEQQARDHLRRRRRPRPTWCTWAPGADHYRAQQSIRTFFNLTAPDRHYVKTALSILNMGFMRGLSPAYMEATPAINDWVADAGRRRRDAAGLRARRAPRAGRGRLPRPAVHRGGPVLAVPQDARGAVAGEPGAALAAGQRLATMATLLHRDADGASLVAALIRRSGLAPRASGCGSYLRAYLAPLLHCLLRHDLAFMPHGENVILVLDGLVRCAVLHEGHRRGDRGDGRPGSPAGGGRADPGRRSPEREPLAIFTDVFDGFLRFLAPTLDTEGVLRRGGLLGRRVADCVRAPATTTRSWPTACAWTCSPRTFPHSCLNRLQLRNTLQMVDLADQSGGLIFAGMLGNPIATAMRVDGGSGAMTGRIRRDAAVRRGRQMRTRIDRDAWGIPHLWAETVDELAFRQGRTPPPTGPGRSRSSAGAPRAILAAARRGRARLGPVRPAGPARRHRPALLRPARPDHPALGRRLRGRGQRRRCAAGAAGAPEFAATGTDAGPMVAVDPAGGLPGPAHPLRHLSAEAVAGPPRATLARRLGVRRTRRFELFRDPTAADRRLRQQRLGADR